MVREIPNEIAILLNAFGSNYIIYGFVLKSIGEAVAKFLEPQTFVNNETISHDSEISETAKQCITDHSCDFRVYLTGYT